MQMGMRAFFAIACASLVACSGAVESTDPAPTSSPVAEPAPAAAPAASVDDADRARTTRDTDGVFAVAGKNAAGAPAGFVCRKGAFCEDFESRGWGDRWTGELTSGRGSVEYGTDSASLGRGSLRLFAMDDASSAYLLQEKGHVGGEWSGMLGFAFRVDQLPGKSLGLSELTVKSEDGPITLRITLRAQGLVLEQIASADCLRDRCEPTAKVIAPAKPNHWYRVRLGMEVNPNLAPPYGRLEASVDDGDVVSTDLTVPFYNGSAFLSAGITQGDAGRRAFADLDDVTLLVR
jgi:hypothetical protein